MSGQDQIVVGIDGGGTRTRVLVADLSGRALACYEGGPGSPERSPRAQRNVQEALSEALRQARRQPQQVVSLVAGLAGMDHAGAEEWAEPFTAVPGITGHRRHVNDAVVAHAGALEAQPGIIVIAGTGSVVFGALPDGSHVRNYDFLHYARAAARQISQDAVFRLLCDEAQPDDSAFVAQVLAFWEVQSVERLRRLGRVSFVADPFARSERFGQMAPLVTAAAEAGSPLARRVCEGAVQDVLTGVRMVAGLFREGCVPVALVGSVARSRFMRHAFRQALEPYGSRLELVEPALPGVAGAVLMALDAVKAPLIEAQERLAQILADLGVEWRS